MFRLNFLYVLSLIVIALEFNMLPMMIQNKQNNSPPVDYRLATQKGYPKQHKCWFTLLYCCLLFSSYISSQIMQSHYRVESQ